MYHPLHLKHFKSKYINHKNISEEFIKTIMQQSASECPFSTFPYIFGMNSEQANQHHNTGNCVALSMFLREKLKKHGIKSILIQTCFKLPCSISSSPPTAKHDVVYWTP